MHYTSHYIQLGYSDLLITLYVIFFIPVKLYFYLNQLQSLLNVNLTCNVYIVLHWVTVVYRQGRSTIFRMPIYPMLHQCQ